MNLYEVEKMVKQHAGEIRETAAQRQAAATRRDQVRSIRHRTGWALIKLGLSVIPTSKGGPGFAQATRPHLGHPHPAP